MRVCVSKFGLEVHSTFHFWHLLTKCSTLFNQSLLLCILYTATQWIQDVIHTDVACILYSQKKAQRKEHVLLFPLFCCACVFVFCPSVENGPIVDITQMLDDPLGLEKSEALMLMPPQTWRCCVLSRPLNLGVKNLWTLLMPVKMWFAIVCTFVPHWQKHCHLLYILKSGLLIKSNLPPMSWFVRFWAAIPGGARHDPLSKLQCWFHLFVSNCTRFAVCVGCACLLSLLW